MEEIYQQLGICTGDTVFIHANMLAFGLLEHNREALVEHFLVPLRQQIGPNGTIVVLTYSFRYASGTPFIFEESPSEAGIFTEYVRKMPEAVRSFHPFSSVVAVGPRAHEICDQVSRSAFGWNSAFHRLHNIQAKCLYLGMTCGDSCTFLHHVEHLYGVSHAYHKAFFHPAYLGGELQSGPYMAYLRNHNAAAYNFSFFANEMRRRSLIQECVYEGAPIQVIQLTDCFQVGMELLEKNPCAFLEKPYYVTE